MSSTCNPNLNSRWLWNSACPRWDKKYGQNSGHNIALNRTLRSWFDLDPNADLNHPDPNPNHPNPNRPNPNPNSNRVWTRSGLLFTLRRRFAMASHTAKRKLLFRARLMTCSYPWNSSCTWWHAITRETAVVPDDMRLLVKQQLYLTLMCRYVTLSQADVWALGCVLFEMCAKELWI